MSETCPQYKHFTERFWENRYCELDHMSTQHCKNCKHLKFTEATKEQLDSIKDVREDTEY